MAKLRLQDAWRLCWSGRRRRSTLVGLLVLGFIASLGLFSRREIRSNDPPTPRRPNLYPSEAPEPQVIEEYVHILQEFIKQAFPRSLHSQLERQLHEHALLDKGPEVPHLIWQTDRRLPQFAMKSWQKRNPDWRWSFVNDQQLDVWARETLQGSEIEWVWRALPLGVMRADLWRYLILLLEGGVYADSDTVCLKSISKWGAGATHWEDPLIDQPATLLVGIEADTVNYTDASWTSSWSRPLQIGQWTILASPGHPILLDAIRRVYSVTVKLEGRIVEDHGHDLDAERLQELRKDALHDRDDWLSVVEWTGPAIFTDSVLAYLAIKHQFSAVSLQSLQTPLMVGATSILPVTGFSPDVGLFGAGSLAHPEAMVNHLFRGSWKREDTPKARPDRSRHGRDTD